MFKSKYLAFLSIINITFFSNLTFTDDDSQADEEVVVVGSLASLRSALNKKRDSDKNVGVIDSDYKREVFVPLINTSRHTVSLRNGDRVCQGELFQNEWYEFKELTESPSTDAEHGAGFGSTGGMSGHKQT